MNTIARVILVTVLVFGSGCAKPDWIQQTLVTVDVTGTWLDTAGKLELNLEQQGAKVTGSMVYLAGSASRVPGAIDGGGRRCVPIQANEWKQSTTTGEMTESGDEMTGNVRSVIGTRGQATLRRLNSSAPPRSQ